MFTLDFKKDSTIYCISLLCKECFTITNPWALKLSYDSLRSSRSHLISFWADFPTCWDVYFLCKLVALVLPCIFLEDLSFLWLTFCCP